VYRHCTHRVGRSLFVVEPDVEQDSIRIPKAELESVQFKNGKQRSFRPESTVMYHWAAIAVKGSIHDS
jgi:hypothetical protein